MINTTASLEPVASIAIKITTIDEAKPKPETSRSSIKAKAAHNLSEAIQRNRLTNGANRSNSLDNETCEFDHRQSLISKSKTLTTLSNSFRIKRTNESGTANGEKQANGERRDSKRRRLFSGTADQSPLWTTLTHARTMTDFVSES